MRYLSVTSGIEAVSVAWGPLGWECVGVSEVEPFPCAVLAHRLPWTTNFGDLNEHAGWRTGPVDIVVGGTPCQSFSAAGLRRGLADARGGLMLRFLELVGDRRPGWVVWENVPGVLSVDGGRAFGTFLGGLAELGYGWAYRVLDAQYFGVAQRRRRVFVVGCAGGAWGRAAAVLFERASLRGDSPPSREKGEGVAHAVAPCLGASGRGFARTGETRGQDCVVPVPEVVGTICDGAHYGGGLNGQDAYTGRLLPVVSHALRGEGFDASEDGTGRGTPIVPVVFDCKGTEVQHAKDVTPPLRAMDGKKQNAGGQLAVAFDTTQVTSKANRSRPKHGDPCHPLAAVAHAPAIVFERRMVRTSGGQPQEGLNHCLRSDSNTVDGAPCVAQGLSVRRLTPRECERLQGFPDDWTRIPWRGKAAEECPDGPRYRALGNSMAVPVMRWIGERLKKVEDCG